MSLIATIFGAVSIVFVVLMTAVMLWFTFWAEDATEPGDREPDADAEAVE